jgi:lipid-A-disaccharide synthase
MMETPFIMVYRVSPLTYLLGKPRIKVPHFAMVNLIAGKEIVPELVQHDFTAAHIVARINELLLDGETRNRQVENLARVKASLRSPDLSDPRHPAERAADIILSDEVRPLHRSAVTQ